MERGTEGCLGGEKGVEDGGSAGRRLHEGAALVCSLKDGWEGA